MHSRIFEILKEGETPTMTTGTFDDAWLTEYGIDYVVNDDDLSGSTDWLTVRDGVSYDKETKAIKFDKKILMKADYEAFTEKASKLSKISLSEFTGLVDNLKESMEWLKHDLDNAFADRWGFYFYNEEYGLMPMNEFLRQIDDREPYYLGNILDYHK